MLGLCQQKKIQGAWGEKMKIHCNFFRVFEYFHVMSLWCAIVKNWVLIILQLFNKKAVSIFLTNM